MDAPTPLQERLLLAMLERSHLRGVTRAPQAPPPVEWGAQPFGMVRRAGGVMAALHVPAKDARGVVLFGHPARAAGKAHFHDCGRVAFVRSLGFAAATFDHGGFGESDDASGLYHREWADALAWARRRYPGKPVHVWAIGLSGAFAHHALASDAGGVTTAIFEDVPARLGWAPMARAWMAPMAHAPRMAAEHVLYVAGGHADATRAAQLADAAGPFARVRVVEGAREGEAWEKGGEPLRAAVEATLLAD